MNLFRRNLFTGFFILYSIFLHAGNTIELDSRAKIMFPSMPEIIDTLGQISYSMSNASGYYACIVYPKAIAADKLPTLDRSKFYTEMYEKMQDPSHDCKLIKKSVINNQDILGMEFYAQCQESADFPGIRYKQIFIYGSTLYVIDYWTHNALSANSVEFKSSFFASFSIKKDETAIIPGAIESTGHTNDIDSFEWTNYVGYIGLAIALVLALVFLRKKPKK